MVRKEIDRLTAEAVTLLREMVAIPSPSFSEEAVCTHICGWMQEKGMPYERVGNNIIVKLMTDPGRPTLMLCAHIDTVEPCEGYSFDPYKPQNCPEGVVLGLGSNDDGASVVSMIAVMRYFGERYFNASQNDISTAQDDQIPNLMLVLTCEEERSGVNGMTGLWGTILSSQNTNSQADNHIKVDYAIVGEPTQMKAATSERGLLVIDATAHGLSGHAARNEGVNAIEIAIKDIEAIKSHTFSKISPRMGKVNLNVTQINAGTTHNVIPDTCTFVIDIRPTEQYTNEDILKELQQICKSELRARNLKNRSSATREASPLQQTAEALNIETFSSPTTSDWMRIDCDAVKMGPGDSARSHKKDEYVTLKEIEGAIETYIEFIKNLKI